MGPTRLLSAYTSGIKHHHTITSLRDDAHVVGDQNEREPRSRTRSTMIWMICAWIVTSSAVVGSSAMMSSGISSERHGYDDALLHAA